MGDEEKSGIKEDGTKTGEKAETHQGKTGDKESTQDAR